MKKGTWVMFFWLCVTVCTAQSHKGFRWIGNNHTLYKIDVPTGNLSWEQPGGMPFSAGKIVGWDSLRKEIPGDFEVVPHYMGDSLLITIPGTGQVYQLNDTALRLTRLDRTFFKGYNFNAHQFVRRDTVFSIGGEGFWQKHSIITFYDPKNAEWSLHYGQNHHPYFTKDIFSGYSAERDVFFSLNTASSFAGDTSSPFLSIFDFKSKKWEIKGELDREITDVVRKNYKSVWTGKYLFLYNDLVIDKVLFLDPFNNRKYVYDCPVDHFFLSIAEVYARNGFLYSRDLTSSGEQFKKGLDSLAISTIISTSVLSGQVYHRPSISPWLYASPFILLLLCIAGWIFWRRRQRKIINQPIELSEPEIAAVREFVKYPTKKFTTIEVNSLLQIEKKTYDNQRQIRNRIIATINQQFVGVLENKELIFRSPNTEDKRMMDYYVNPELKSNELATVKESLLLS